MTVRVRRLSDEPDVLRRPLRLLEYLLLFAGLVALDGYIWVNATAAVSENYDNWALDEQRAGREPAILAFLGEKLGAGWLAPERHQQPVAPIAPGVKAQPVPAYALLGRVGVRRLGLEAIVREGVDSATLLRAVGHMPSTPLPGQLGNAALAAHRDTLFRKLRQIRKDDHITFQSATGEYEYVVESLSIVKPSDLSVLNSAKGDRLLTLITCYPFNYIGSAPNRFIVRARLLDATARAQPHPNSTKS